MEIPGPNQTKFFLLLILDHILQCHHHSNLSSIASEISSPMPVQLVDNKEKHRCSTVTYKRELLLLHTDTLYISAYQNFRI